MQDAQVDAAFSSALGCATSVAPIDFTLRRADKLTARVERDGERAQTSPKRQAFAAECRSRWLTGQYVPSGSVSPCPVIPSTTGGPA